MSLTDEYRQVQADKDDPMFELPPRVVEEVSKSFRDQFGRAITSIELKTVLDGIGWMSRMVEEERLDMEEIMGIAEDLTRHTRRNLNRADTMRDADDYLAAGVGAGFFTGLWLGRRSAV